MAAVAVGELAKMKEKVVRPRKLLFFLSQKAEVADEQQEGEANVLTSNRKQPSSSLKSPSKAKNQEATLSEATVCLLMDRFAPC